jgi:glutamate-1-semialdehyde 2,1-aminomutase
MELMRFTQSGVEATGNAIRLARAVTGKMGVVKVEGCYHGNHDTLLVSIGMANTLAAGPDWAPTSQLTGLGLPSEVQQHVSVIPFNDLNSLERVLKQRQNEIACFIVEPCMTNGGVILPEPGYLKGVRELTRHYNVILIFDEVKVGCRIAAGGATEKFGIEPDLVTLAKVIGGGTPLGAFGGKRDIMSQIYPLGMCVHSGTYNGNPLTTAAGLACLQNVLTAEGYRYLDSLGERLANGLNEIIRRLQFPASVSALGPLGGIQFQCERPKNYREALRRDQGLWDEYWYGMLAKGVIPMGCGWGQEYSISVAHSTQDIDETLGITEDVLGAIKKHLL